MKLFALPNLSSQDVYKVDPETDDFPRAEFEDKNEFRAWCADRNTKHAFYSAVEALTPSNRITVDNPPKLMHGFVADYDANNSDDMVALIPDNGVVGLLPSWVTKTRSEGGRRLVWEFEKPILVDNEELAERFLKLLARELRVESLLSGFDKASLKLSQYFEWGKQWQRIPGGEPISSKALGVLFFHAASQRQIVQGAAIPIEAVAAEVERQFPGRWPGEFIVGARGPLFWLNDGIDRIGCQIGDFGVIAYSERAGKSFLHWGEVLGQKFVREFETQRLGSAIEGLWFDGRQYWRQGEDERWNAMTTDNCAQELKVLGISGRVGPKDTASEIDKVLVACRRTNTVDGAVPFVCNAQQIVNVNGMKYLNISTRKAMEPAAHGNPEDFPWLNEFFFKVWDEKYPCQRDYFLAWFKRFWLSAYDRQIQSGHAVVIAGEPGSGKTLLNYHILGSAVGGWSDAGDVLMGEVSFNKEAAESALLCVDDNKGAATYQQHRAFSEAIKKHVANPTVPYKAKFRDSFTIPWAGRVVVTTNTDTESLQIIPSLDHSIEGKIMLFKWGAWKPKFLPNKEQEALIAKELPFFLAWLRDWQEPDYVMDPGNPRFGVKFWHHPELVNEARASSPNHRLTEVLEEWRKVYKQSHPNETEWVGTATALLSELHNVQTFQSILRDYTAIKIGRALSIISKYYQPIKEAKVSSGGKKIYVISMTEAYD